MNAIAISLLLSCFVDVARGRKIRKEKCLAFSGCKNDLPGLLLFLIGIQSFKDVFFLRTYVPIISDNLDCSPLKGPGRKLQMEK